jgi:hypothetical protein
MEAVSLRKLMMIKRAFILIALLCLLPSSSQETSDDPFAYSPDDKGRVLRKVEDANGVRYTFKASAVTVSQGVVCLSEPHVMFDESKGLPLPVRLHARPDPVDMTFCGRAKYSSLFNHDVAVGGPGDFVVTEGKMPFLTWFKCKGGVRGARALVWGNFPEGTLLTAADPVEEESRIRSYLRRGQGVNPISGSKQ